MKKAMFFPLFFIAMSNLCVSPIESAEALSITSHGGVVTMNIAEKFSALTDDKPDFLMAKPMTMPRVASKTMAMNRACISGNRLFTEFKPGISPGNKGSGKPLPIEVPYSDSKTDLENTKNNAPADVTTLSSGIANHPFSTARVSNVVTTRKQDKTYKSYPYRASGKLFFTYQGGTATCSAALIQPGVIVTAAHCVMSFGSIKGFYANWVFIPAYHKGKAPFGVWYANTVSVKESYANGSDTCVVAGVVCESDIAVIAVANKKRKRFPGNRTGWLGFGWNGFSFATGFPGFPNGLAQISQLGYSGSLDFSEQMQRNDSFGYIDVGSTDNTIIGTLMNEGSSGGPWIVNLGTPPQLSGITSGADSEPNVIIGVTSWGYSSSLVKEAGASPFRSTNIVQILSELCAANTTPLGSCI